MIGRDFNVGKDIILKSCLVLSGFSDISFKVDMDLIGNSIYSKSVADISRIAFKYSGQSLALDISGESTELSCTVKELLNFYEK